MAKLSLPFLSPPCNMTALNANPSRLLHISQMLQENQRLGDFVFCCFGGYCDTLGDVNALPDEDELISTAV